MSFNFKRYIRFAYVAIFKGGNIEHRLSPKRIGWIVFFYTVFPLLELVHRIFFLMDNIVYRGYRQAEIEAPIFIIGNPRSGTTFFHRLLAEDEHNFTWMRMWEILFAPSITQRKIVDLVTRLDRRIGGPLHALVAARQKRWQEQNVMHKIALQAPEEDEYLLLHIWSTIMVWLYSGFLGEMDDWVEFDTAMPEGEKRRVMDFYVKCLKRHLHAHGAEGKHYLAKNPCFSPKVDALYEYFPDAKIVYLVRSPLKMIPSYISILNFEWDILGDPVGERSGYPNILDMADHWYTYPLARLDEAPAGSHVILRFDDMVSDPDRAVRQIYEGFDLTVTPTFAETLRQETIRSQRYQSRHRYSLDETGLTREEIVSRFWPVFERFGFDTAEVPSARDVPGEAADAPSKSTEMRESRP